MRERPRRGPAQVPDFNLTAFRDDGYLQELNRRFLHPLGLALALEVDPETSEPNGRIKVWDGRDDPEGYVFVGWTAGDRERGARIDEDLQRRLKIREERLGFGIQPL
jgi:hypothetical protein